VVGGAFLLAVGRIIGAIQIEHEVGGHAVTPALTQIDLAQRYPSR
jgi:hypothetical protein